MGLWSRGIKRSEIGNIEDFFNYQNNSLKYEIIDEEKEIVDIVGNVVIREDDIRDGELRIKIRNLDGDLILSVSEIRTSVIPEEMTGKIIFNSPNPKDDKKTEPFEKEISGAKTTAKESRGLENKDVSKSKTGHAKSELFKKIWEDLRDTYGFSEGDDIPEFQFREACENYRNPDDISIEEFEKKFDVNIG